MILRVQGQVGSEVGGYGGKRRPQSEGEGIHASRVMHRATCGDETLYVGGAHLHVMIMW